MNWRQIIPTAFTIAAMLSGFLSILVTFEGMHQEKPELYAIAAQLIMLAMILDGLDGNVARWLKGQSEFGAELDTYVDFTAFGIAPAILIFAVALQNKNEFFRILLPSAVALSGMVRLARFKVKDPLRGQGGYSGLPITANAGWVAIFVFLSQQNPEDSFGLTQGKMALLFLAGIILFIVLQVSTFRYPKPTKKPVLFIPCIIVVALLFHPAPEVHNIAAKLALALGMVYIFFGPLFVKGLEAHKARVEAKNDASRNGGEDSDSQENP